MQSIPDLFAGYLVMKYRIKQTGDVLPEMGKFIPGLFYMYALKTLKKD
jgi:hypothetical protein